MEYETRFNDKKNYDDIFNQFFNVVKNMRDEKTGLYYHAYDSSREMFWCDRVTGLSQNFWLRALGCIHGAARHLRQGGRILRGTL